MAKRAGRYRRLTQEDFIARCKSAQKVDLDYSEVEYISQHEKVKVRCKTHDVYLYPRAQDLLKGVRICKECLKDYKSKKATANLDTFLEKFNNKFPDHGYDFSLANYTKSSEYITVVCPNGHKVCIKPNNLMSGHRCALCHNEKVGYTHRKGRDGYLKTFQEVHGHRYNYSLVEDFSNCKQKVTVVCKEHGAFKITPDNHTQGKGCPSCSKGGYSELKAGVFYILKFDEKIIKFGITNNFENRLTQLNTNSARQLGVLFTFQFEDGSVPKKIEQRILKDQKIVRGVVSKQQLQSGYTETTTIDNLQYILDMVGGGYVESKT